MDKRRQDLEAQQDELHMELLMDDYAAELGRQVREEAEAAYASGEITLPPELEPSVHARIADAPAPDKPRKPAGSALRYGLVAALTAVLLFGALIAVQATSFDFFGRVGAWTDSVFYFTGEADSSSGSEEEMIPAENPIQTMLQIHGLPGTLSPTWLPEGFTLREIETNSLDDGIEILFAVATCDGEEDILISVIQDNGTGFIESGLYEKTDDDVQIYTSRGRSFYLFLNNNGWVGVWCDGRYLVAFAGVNSVESLKTMIDSMGERK